MRDKNTFGYGHSEYDEMERDEDTYVSDDPDGHEPIRKAVDLLDDDDGLGDDNAGFRHRPYCPIDVLDALEHCGRLAYEIAIGEAVSTEEAENAAGRAVKCLADYDYEQQPWFTEAWPFVKEPEPYDTRADDESKEPPADAGSGDKCERAATT